MVGLGGRSLSFQWDRRTGALALAAAVLCLVPQVGFLLAWHMMVGLGTFTMVATVPALLALGGIEFALARQSQLLFNRFAVGLLGGIAGTLAFDLVRLPLAYGARFAPDYVPVIGQHLIGETIGIAPTAVAVFIGYSYHYLLVGALVGATYSLLLGRRKWYVGTAIATIAGLAFILLPQFQLLAIARGFDLAVACVVQLLAFAAAGTVTGAVVERFGKTRANALKVVFLREEPVEAGRLERLGSFAGRP